MPTIKNNLRSQGFSEEVTDILMASWRAKTSKQYDSSITKWRPFCSSMKRDVTKAAVSQVLDFLMEQFKRGLGASGIATYRSAVADYVPRVDRQPIGEQKIVVRSVKGIKSLWPIVPKYTTTWDTDHVITYLKGMEHTNLKDLVLKMTMIIALITAQRA